MSKRSTRRHNQTLQLGTNSNAKSIRQKPLSPPVSPQSKVIKLSSSSSSIQVLLSKKPLSTGPPSPRQEAADHTQWMTINANPGKVNKDSIVSFLKKYRFDLGPKTRGKKSSPVKQRHTNPDDSANQDITSSSPVSDGNTYFRRLPYETRSKTVPTSSEEIPNRRTQSPRKKLSFSNSSGSTGKSSIIDQDQFLKNGTVQDVHDSDAASIPNFQPDMSTIRTTDLEGALKRIGFPINKSLKADHGLDKLDSKEMIISSTLKLTPDQYQDTLRRFFAEKARKTYLKTTFKKTDAQKACRIDVNKTSKLYEIFQRCGLLEDKLYQ